MAEALRLTAIGMGLVFAAMTPVLVAMMLLTRLRDAELESKVKESVTEAPAVDERSLKLRVAMVAAAIARAKSPSAPAPGTLYIPLTPAASGSWWTHHQARQLHPSLHKRA